MLVVVASFVLLCDEVMMSSKTGGSLKGIFEPAKAQAAQAVMQPQAAPATPPARNKKAGGRGVRISGYVPPEISEALNDEVITQMTSSRHRVSLNDVLCSILADWHERRKAAQ